MNVGGLQVGNDLCTAGRYMVIWIYNNTHTHRVTGPAAGGEKKRTKMTVV
jgi:hypothetical protein